MEEMLMQQIRELRHEIERLQAVVEIQNVMGRYETLLVPQTVQRVGPETFAMWREDVSMEVSGLGVFTGAEGITKLFVGFLGLDNEPKQADGTPDIRGAMYLHHINTPMIEVAKDNQTAHAVWFSSGVETPFNKATGKRQAKWCWGKYSAEFIKGECGWRIWHMHWFRGFMHDYYSSWVDAHESTPEKNVACKDFDFVKPTTYHHPYNPNEEILSVPCCPDPYETHQDSSWIMGDWIK